LASAARYEDYRAAIPELCHQFDRAKNDHERMRSMIEMEQLAFDEMCNFLRAPAA
jgi:hypothetical protein